MIFIDTNVVMYLTGGDHPLKLRSQEMLEEIINDQVKLVTDAEVYQEILHRYTALKYFERIPYAFDILNGLVDEVFSIDITVVEHAKTIILSYQQTTARDAIHLASMKVHKVQRIMTFDKDFDSFTSISRLF